MALYERDTEGKLVPIAEGVPEEVIRAIERYDEEAIVQRMTTGIASEEFIYDYPIKTKTGVKRIIGISTDGAYELASMLGNLEVLQDIKVDKESDPDYFYAMVRAKDIVRNVTLLGVARQCKFMLDEGNRPIHDRLNEHAFVSSISKAQRNAILHLAPEEAIVKIINTWEARGKSKQFRPPKLEVDETTKSPAPASATVVTKPPTAVTPQFSSTEVAIAEQQEKLKGLRMQVHNRFQTDLAIGVEQRKGMLKERFGVESLTDLSELQLRECLSWVEEMIQKATKATATPSTPAPTPTPTAEKDPDAIAKGLGFEGHDEQGKLRGNLYAILTSPNQLNLKDAEAKEFVSRQGYTSTSSIPKEKLLGLIKEANELVKAKQTPSNF